VLALCSLGAVAGVHAAGGDDAAPASIIAKILGTYDAAGEMGTDASELRPVAGEEAGSGERPPAAEAPATPQPSPDGPSATPAPTPAPTPNPTPDAPAPVAPTDPMSPEYNPFTTEGDPAYVTDAEKSAWLGREAVVRACMADAGFEYLDWQWWLGGSPQPVGQSPDEAAAWAAALRGSGGVDDGCRAAGQRAAEEAAAAGTPLAGAVPPLPGAEVPTERENWLAFQAAVRSCMAEQGYEYRYWEYWNPAYDTPGGSAAMPPGLEGDARATWSLAAFGTADAVGGAPNDGGGCWADGLAQSGYRTFD
jgi:hypothetical protein